MHNIYKFIIISAVVLQLREWQTQRIKYIYYLDIYL